MNGTSPPPFDPSKPFTAAPTSSGSPPFDPSKPFTQESAALRQPADGTSQSSPTWYQRVTHGFEAPFVGADVLASQAEQYVPGIPKETAAKDLDLAQQERASFEKQAPGFSGWDVVGSLLNPLNYLGGPVPIKGAGFAATLGRATQSAATTAAIQPEHGPAAIAAGTIGGAALSTAAEPIARALAGNTTQGLDRFIRETFTSAVKPSVAGKFTRPQAEQYQEQIGSAVNSILGNKANLRLTDDAGMVRAGELPQSLDEFSQAIGQTKQKIFQEYDARAKAAGQAFGGRNMVSLAPIAGELQTVANSTVIRDLSPHVANLAQHMADTMKNRGSYTTEEAQAAIQHLNAQLKALYGGAPTRETVGASNVQALVADKLREGLDAAVKRATGPGYQDLKNQYGALRRLETDVVRRAIVVGRQEPGRGLMGRIGDIASAQDVIHGLLRFDPASIATGIGIRAFTGEMRRLRSPNRAVKRIFNAAEQRAALRPSPTRTAAAAAVRQTTPVAGAVSGSSVYENMTGQVP